MTTIKSIADLKKVLDKKILSSVKSIAKSEERKLKEEIQEKVYNAYTPKYYKRTKQLKNSVTSEVTQDGSVVRAKIFHDTSKMDQVAPVPGYNIGTHHSTVKSYIPQEYAYFLPVTIEEGTSGRIFGDGAYLKPRRYFSSFVTKLKNTYKESLRAQLIKSGLTVKRG